MGDGINDAGAMKVSDVIVLQKDLMVLKKVLYQVDESSAIQ
ncbi:magnesium-transporting ATPase (P-type) [Enterococcus ureilyticus]|nr:magnesium-transporting ATPase (P-type) [Enterococcus ureilyticus]